MRKILLFSISLLFGLSLAIWIYTHIDLKDVFLCFGFLVWGQIIVLFTLTLFSSLIPIPAMLGIYERTNILAFQTVQLTAETGLSFHLNDQIN